MRKQGRVVGSLIALWVFAAPVLAHEVWMAQRSKKLALIYGTGAEDLDTVQRFAKIRSIKGYDAAGKEVPVTFKATDSLVVIDEAGDPAQLATVFDNGVWSKRPDGEWVDKGRDVVTDAVVSGHNYKYNTHLRKLPAGASTPVPGLALQLVAVGKTFPKQMNDALTVQVLFEGKPLAGARVFQDMVTNPAAKPLLTDEEGKATLRVRNDGLNVIMAMHVGPPENPQTTFMTEHVATLSFLFAPPPE